MGLKIKIEEQTDTTYFSDIRMGEFFLCNGSVYVKLEEFFIADDIVTELEEQHDLTHEDDIVSDRYNCWLVGSECDYRSFDEERIVNRVNIDMNVRYIK